MRICVKCFSEFESCKYFSEFESWYSLVPYSYHASLIFSFVNNSGNYLGLTAHNMARPKTLQYTFLKESFIKSMRHRRIFITCCHIIQEN